MRQGISNSNYSTGIGYITIPVNVDRKRYVSSCYRKERVSIQLDDGGSVLKDCYVSKDLLSSLKFPKTNDKLGSCVAFIVPKYHDIPIIVGVINRPGENDLLDEHIYKKVISSDVGVVSVEMKPEGGIFINVDSAFENEGNIYVLVKSKNNTSKLDVKCFGDINIYAEGKTTLETLKDVNLKKIEVDKGINKIVSEIILSEEGFVYSDKFENKIECTSDGKIIHHEGSSPVVKGDELLFQLQKMKMTLDSFIETYLTTVTTIVGDAGISAKATMEAAMLNVREEDFSKINSEKSFIK